MIILDNVYRNQTNICLYKDGRLLHKIENENVTVRNCKYYTKKEFTLLTKRPYWRSTWYTVFEEQRNWDLRSATVGFFSSPSAKTFTLTYLSIGISKYKTPPRYVVITERFQKDRMQCNCHYTTNEILIVFNAIKLI